MTDQRTGDELPDGPIDCGGCGHSYWPGSDDRGRCSVCRAREIVALVIAERQRQVDAEGYTPAHDDQHVGGELALAAASYAQPPGARAHFNWKDTGRMAGAPQTWPGRHWQWKPDGDRVRELVKASALILAEIDRLLRKDGV